ncbi:MAG: hypothetical protein U0Y68_08025 [Blastocatellia bacterium]
MKLDEKKMVLSETAAQNLTQAHPAAVAAVLDKSLPHVIGVGAGIKWKNGVPTGEPALVVLVTHKVPKSELSKASLIPTAVQGLKTDVLAVGHIFAMDDTDPVVEDDTDPVVEDDTDPVVEDDTDPVVEDDTDPVVEDDTDPVVEDDTDPVVEAARQYLRRNKRRVNRVRPICGGLSVGYRKLTAGTIGACVYDLLPGASFDPPQPGTGFPKRYYILSNNHVLAYSNAGHLGASILQPAAKDGGRLPQDRIGYLRRYVPIDLAPAVPLEQHNNLVDAALAEVPFHLADRSIKWIGDLRGWRRKADVKVGTLVKKTGRSTKLTTGRIIVVNATLDVNYRNGRKARFKEQILTTNMSAAGDSGALITTLDNVAVGLLFAGSTEVTVANQIENVRSLLRVEIAEQVL